MSDKKIELNIQPQAGILGVFSRLNYKAWFAIGEFVDNSTASFFENEKKMHNYGINGITIRIDYNPTVNSLTIIDDAYGMEIEDFKRAIILDSVPENQSGRNEFGMGLKTAASWFGQKWSVKSTRLGSENEYYTEIDINNLRDNNINSISILNNKVDRHSHGTTIVIEQITKRIDAPQTKKKIKELLSSMYRRDLISKKIEIILNGEFLTFEEYEPLTFRDRVWRKDLNFQFEFNNKKYRVTGFVGILSDGGYGKAGFALFRRNRVIMGGLGENYKPINIFVQAQSTIAHKLYGELNVEDFPVNQAKDGFVWDDGLEVEFDEALKLEISEYISIAKMTNKERIKEQELDSEVSDRIQKEVNESLQKINNEAKVDNSDDKSEIEKEFVNELLEENNGKETLLEDKAREYPIKLNKYDTRILTVMWAVANDEYWIKMNDETFTVIININHPFFKPYSQSEDFKRLLEKFVISYFISFYIAKKEADNDGYVLPGDINVKMNEYLKILTEE